MTKTEWRTQRKKYRAYLKACAQRQLRVWMADSPSHAEQNDARPAYVERPFGYSRPFDVSTLFGWKSWTPVRIGNLIRKHQRELGVEPKSLSAYSIDCTARSQKIRRMCDAVFERQLIESGEGWRCGRGRPPANLQPMEKAA